MKLLKLRLKNLNSFKREIKLNFQARPLSDASLLAITGPTGSGKTTLLDALCVALYNKTPRLGGKGSRNVTNLLTQGSTEGFSEVLFEANSKPYLAEWSVRRSRTGTLRQTAKLLYADTGELITDRLIARGRAEDIREMSVENAVTQILGLDFTAFNRSVMLAQGQFAAFLKAEPERKREILEATTGMDFYERLRAVLSDKVKQVESDYGQAEKVLESVQQVNVEEIVSARSRLAEVDEELEKLNKEKQQIALERTQEEQRVGKHEQLAKAKEQMTLLEEQEKKISQLEEEINRARRAADIHSEAVAFETEKENLEKAEIAIQRTQKSLDSSQRDYEESKVLFESADGDWKRATEESKEKFEDFRAAERMEGEAQGQFSEANKRQADIIESRDAIADLDASIESNSRKKNALERDIETAENFLRANPLPENSDELFAEAKVIANSLDNLEKSLSGTSTELEGEKRRQEVSQNKLKKLQQERTTLEDDRAKAAEAHEMATESLSALLEEGSAEDWENRKNLAESLRDVAKDYENASEGLEASSSKAEEYHKQLSEGLQKLDDIIVDIEVKGKELQTADERVKRFEAEEKYAMIAGQVVLLRKELLRENEPCPVCGAKEHPWADKEEVEEEKLIKDVREKLDKTREERRKLQANMNVLERQKTILEARKANLESNLSDIHEEIEKLEGRIEEAHKLWQYEGEVISSDIVEANIQKAETCLKNIRTATDSQTRAENRLQMLAVKLENIQTQTENTDEILNGIAQKIHRLAEDIQRLRDEIAQTADRFWSAIPEEFRAASPSDGLEMFQKRISAVKLHRDSLAENLPILAKLITLLENDENNLAQERARLANFIAQANQYRKRGEQLLSQAKEKTGGLKAVDARQNLEKELQKKSDRREQLEDDLQKQTGLLTRAQTSLDEAVKHREYARKSFCKAEEEYRVALTSANFVSAEEHQRAYMSAIEEKNREIIDYRQRMHALKEHINNLSKAFMEKDFDSE